MSPGEEYQLRRENFRAGVGRYFSFLLTEFGYRAEDPVASSQPNGVVIRDTFRFTNRKRDRLIEISNAYHPVDYGFEINCYRPSVSLDRADGIMVGFLLKEEQDLEQNYLKDMARALREEHVDLIRGVAWPEA